MYDVHAEAQVCAMFSFRSCESCVDHSLVEEASGPQDRRTTG